ncbi:MAG: hypothetical protein ABIP30_07655 [Ferruginibacter sp.]
MNLLTVKQLDEWMVDNCFNDSYGIGNRNIHEGCGLDTFGSLYVWYYTERGQRKNLKYFQTEKEAVAFAFKTIIADKSANIHMIGFIKDKSKEDELLTELRERNIEFWKDEIPYGGPNDIRSRVFVFGCDIKLVLDLQKQFGV